MTQISIHSTTRVETAKLTNYRIEQLISIHSTTRVETALRVSKVAVLFNFNPLHHEGGDQKRYTFVRADDEFESTPTE